MTEHEARLAQPVHAEPDSDRESQALTTHVLAELLNRYRQFLFKSAIRAIEQTPPITLHNSERFTLLSLVNHRDILAYLLACKTFVQGVMPQRIVVIADPDMTANDRAMLREHIPAIEIRDAQRYRDPALPVGGCWERLIAISDEVKDGYVVQLDADTVTVGAVDDIRNYIRGAASFLLAPEDGVVIQDLESAAAWARQRAAKIDHVQIQAEANLDALVERGLRYARTCAGFSGFPQNSFDRELLRFIGEKMSGRIGRRWYVWGSEQVTSNLVCASYPQAQILPHPKYCNADKVARETVFLHFIGYTRFTSRRYESVARDMMQTLAGTHAAA